MSPQNKQDNHVHFCQTETTLFFKAACLDIKLTILFALDKDFIMKVPYLHIS